MTIESRKKAQIWSLIGIGFGIFALFSFSQLREYPLVGYITLGISLICSLISNDIIGKIRSREEFFIDAMKLIAKAAALDIVSKTEAVADIERICTTQKDVHGMLMECADATRDFINRH